MTGACTIPCDGAMPSLVADVALACGDGTRIHSAEFRTEVLAAAAALRGETGLVNLCEDRRKFLVAFAAALLRGRTVLLPPSQAPASIAELRARYPGCVVVDDSFTPADDPPFDPPGRAGDFIAAIG